MVSAPTGKAATLSLPRFHALARKLSGGFGVNRGKRSKVEFCLWLRERERERERETNTLRISTDISLQQQRGVKRLRLRQSRLLPEVHWEEGGSDGEEEQEGGGWRGGGEGREKVGLVCA